VLGIRFHAEAARERWSRPKSRKAFSGKGCMFRLFPAFGMERVGAGGRLCPGGHGPILERVK